MQATFLEPFEAVPGMADAYRQWGRQRAHFVYLSNGPWPLYPLLEKFMTAERFPLGVFEMQDFRVKDSSVMNLFADPVVSKMSRIEKYFVTYPKARFVLVGDSGEKDPEIYGEIARKHPERVAHIFIRNTSDEPIGSDRYKTAFKDVFATEWTIFDDAEVLTRWKFAE
jgi:phosphatidate phosphatase APP1